MSLQFFGELLFCILLLVIPFVLDNILKLNLSDRLLRGSISLLVLIGICGAILDFVMWQNHLWLTILAAFIVVAVTCIWALLHFCLKLRRLLIPSLTGLLVVMLFLAPLSAILVTPFPQSFSPQNFLPIVCLLSGSISFNMIRGIRQYYVGLKNHAALYNYLLGNGCTHRQAVAFFFHRSLQSTALWVLRRISTTILTASPLLLLALIWAGVPVMKAAVLNFMFFFAVLSGSMSSLFISLWFARRYTFDEYSRLQPVS